jgi:hypothetical protein
MQIGDRVESLTFIQPNGSSLALAELLGKPLLLIFLRHLA